MFLYAQEVGVLIRNALELRVRQFQEARYQKIQPKPRKDLNLTTPLCLEGRAHKGFVLKPKLHLDAYSLVRFETDFEHVLYIMSSMNEIRTYYIHHYMAYQY